MEEKKIELLFSLSDTLTEEHCVLMSVCTSVIHTDITTSAHMHKHTHTHIHTLGPLSTAGGSPRTHFWLF